MRYLIDGYNLFFKLEEEILPLEEKREEFISLLDEEVGDLRLQVLLIFDSHRENAEDFASKRKLKNLEVSFSPKTFQRTITFWNFLNGMQKTQLLLPQTKSSRWKQNIMEQK